MFHATRSGVRFGLLDGAWVDVAALHLSSFSCVFSCFLESCFYPLVFIGYYRTFYRHIVQRLRPLFVGGAIQIHIDWLIDSLKFGGQPLTPRLPRRHCIPQIFRIHRMMWTLNTPASHALRLSVAHYTLVIYASPVKWVDLASSSSSYSLYSIVFLLVRPL